MKPLLIITLPEYTTQQVHKELADHIVNVQKNGHLEEYEVLIIHGGTARVYYPARNWLKFYYYKIKAWAILKIQKNK